MKKRETGKSLMISILSLSLLTVMAGAAVAPALGIIKEHFAGENPLFVQMIISMPALFIIAANVAFPRLCRIFGTRTLVLSGLILYTAGGCAAGAFDNIFLVLTARALVGIGVGIFMPLSTGLLTFYYDSDRTEKLMGYSSAMNQIGGAIATLLSGLLAGISWRASFLVYGLGLISIVLCLIFLPNDRIDAEESSLSFKTFKENLSSIVSMFLLMVTFFIYPANFAITIAAEEIIPQNFIAVIMAGMDAVAFCGGLLFVHIKRIMRTKIRFMAPVLFIAGYLMLTFIGGWTGALLGPLCIGFANGEGIPYIISTASRKAGKAAAATVMPMISAALYLGQFMTPVIISAAAALAGKDIAVLPYYLAVGTGLCFLITSRKVK